MVYVYIYISVVYLFFWYDKIASWFMGYSLERRWQILLLNYLGQTSLHFASLNGHQSVVKILLDRGANIDQKDEDGEFINQFIYVIIIQLICLCVNLPICHYI